MKYLLFVIVLVIVVITAGCVQPGPTKVQPKSTVVTTPVITSCVNKCNGICYDPDKKLCCGGTIYPFDEHGSICCGGKMYHPQKGWECCPNPYLLPKRPSWENYTAVWINISTQHCCAGKVVAGGRNIRPGDEWTDCGNSSCYDPGTQSCCFLETEQGMKIWLQRGSSAYMSSTNWTSKVYEGKNRCCTTCLNKLCPEGMMCCPCNTGNETRDKYGEPTCYDPKKSRCNNESCFSDPGIYYGPGVTHGWL